MRLLIIDDDTQIVKSLSDFFKNNQCTVDVAFNGETGLNLALSNEYDLIITDYLLPKLNGDKLIIEIKKSGGLAPILAISTRSEIDQKINLLNFGADDYLVKPFSFIELYARAMALLRRPSKPSNESLLIFSDLKLNLLSHEAIRNELKIYLTTKEFLILKMLMKHPQVTITKQEIIEKVWDDACNPMSNILEAHMLHLRHKIDFKKPFLIQTVPGRGYRLSEKINCHLRI